MDIAPNVFPLIVVPGEDAYEGSVGQNIEFTVTASGGTQPYSYQWNFEDGSTSTEQNPTHVYTATGEYDATITVTDNSETSESGTVIVTIIDAVILPPSEPTNSNIWLFVGIIAIIVIVGTAIVIYILRR